MNESTHDTTTQEFIVTSCVRRYGKQSMLRYTSHELHWVSGCQGQGAHFPVSPHQTGSPSVRKVISRSKLTGQIFLPMAEQNFRIHRYKIFPPMRVRKQ